jgi:hypothetical protein
MISREIRLKSRRDGVPARGNFEIVERELPRTCADV